MTRGSLKKKLSGEKSWLIINDGSDGVKVVKEFGIQKRKVIEFSLVCVSEGIYIKHPHYEFRSTVSHYCSTQKDIRLSLNKTFLSSIIKTLRKIGLWEAIVNKDFLQVNRDNSKSNKGVVKRELRRLLG